MRSTSSSITNIVVDGTDNFPTRYLVNDACVLLNKPNVYGSIFRFERPSHRVRTRGLGRATVACTPNRAAGRGAELRRRRVLGILPGVIGCIQATETIKLILGVGEPLVGRLLHYDALNMTFKTFKIRRDPKWAIGAPHPPSRG